MAWANIYLRSSLFVLASGSSNDYTGIQGNFRFPPPLERMKALIPDVFAAMNAYVKAGCTVSNVHTKPDCDTAIKAMVVLHNRRLRRLLTEFPEVCIVYIRRYVGPPGRLIVETPTSTCSGTTKI
ncbi:unnamed protein product [Linum tenue]|uniref:Uncharacterized protein n=1 Tax=Linum tenue TaxID=586396 RepID=A0AAV0L4H4_9ROSI|nr:unnamed protein product [Linum tenue]